MSVRQFFIENEFGARKSFMTRLGFLNNPDGFGYAMNRAYESSKNGFYEITKEEYEQPNPTGDLVFLGNDPYKDARDLIDWIETQNELKLGYCPYGINEFYMDVVFNSISKTERATNGVLTCPVSFDGLTPWYDKYPLVFTFTSEPETNYKRYEYRYPYRYAVGATPGSIDFSIQGHFPGEVYLFAQGVIQKPRLTLKQTYSGKVLGKLDLSAVTIEDDEQLIFSTRARGAGVWRQKNGIRENLIDSVELSAGVPTFFEVPVNTPLTMILEIENVIDSQSTLSVYRYWKFR